MRRVALCLAAVVALTAFASAGGARSGGTIVRGTGLVEFGGRLSVASHLRSYSYVFIGQSDFDRAASLPGKVLYYTSGFTVPQAYSNGVAYSTARRNGWLLQDSNGKYLIQDTGLDAGAPDYVGDVGSRGYERAFVKDVLTVLRGHRGIDGVEIDNVLADPTYYDTCNCFPARYPDRGAWQRANVRFIASVGKALRSHGYYAVANASGYVNAPHRDDAADAIGWWRQLAPYLSGLMDEYWMQSANSVGQLMNDSQTAYYGYWSKWLRLMNVAQSRHVDFFGVTYGGTREFQKMRFARGTFLLGWNGKGGAMIYSTNESGGGDPWSLAWTVDVGRPVAPRVELQRGSDVWARRYSKGLVVVNPTTRPATVTVRSVQYTIAPSDALILQR